MQSFPEFAVLLSSAFPACFFTFCLPAFLFACFFASLVICVLGHLFACFLIICFCVSTSLMDRLVTITLHSFFLNGKHPCNLLACFPPFMLILARFLAFLPFSFQAFLLFAYLLTCVLTMFRPGSCFFSACLIVCIKTVLQIACLLSCLLAGCILAVFLLVFLHS